MEALWLLPYFLMLIAFLICNSNYNHMKKKRDEWRELAELWRGTASQWRKLYAQSNGLNEFTLEKKEKPNG